ncbi:MAG: hypothetical protein COZ06_24690 [Armatimonadetes bacterium CG_4_10_14_3_um_filter_66_18]|nr:MAG: hypothetical protein AUJ96_18405 [Armatimonadetes bacterium CG2_30_66_41]PIU89872.1 MAG: hypothetical protein COS65_27025 [Armatimonadetes bacterium CG06_land_8_20_14_3_00_66_21]PIX45516.1 MAG: hypothetical protein COZ57_15150 [Armatimonadetes bacterium CG_4_8_14_3_um_filter_66_20]PIY42687.1 MAG: hypothetical protein COZ06_24690 [Armatimonadetes bacterium CG_4_10_14_3_um_filter_66_18]PJB75642.1 MAG: hypothetical protein CO096_01720 [Armatimonadetes bacterium CG_4_9_14_3_um_filter_66_14]
MNGRERLLTAVRHEEPDRVPICPRINWAWLDPDKSHRLEELYGLSLDPMEILSTRTPNYARTYPEQYALPDVRVEQTRYEEGNYQVVERTFHTPAGALSDRTKIPPGGREYGMSPNPFKTEFLVKSRDDLPALRYLLPEIGGNYDHAVARQRELGDRGVVRVNVYSKLCRQAGDVRNLQDLMVDYYTREGWEHTEVPVRLRLRLGESPLSSVCCTPAGEVPRTSTSVCSQPSRVYVDRPFFDELLALFQARTMAETKAVMEAGVEWVFANCYYNSLSAGWSPAIFREVFVPSVTAQVELVHRDGGYVDYYDDGKLAHSMEMLADCGVDVLETCTPPPVCDFDLREAKAMVGDRLALKGYVDLL